MRRLPACKLKIYGVTALMVFFFCGVGVSYAKWTQALMIGAGLTTGSINMVYDLTGDFSVSVVEMDATLTETLAQGDEITLQTSLMSLTEKNVQLMVTGDLLLEKLAQSDKMLRLQYDIRPTDDSTVQTIHPHKADFSNPDQELVVFQPEDPVMVVDGKEYDLPANLAGLLPALEWESYSALEQEGSKITGSIYLKLTPESVEALTFHEEIVLEVEDLPAEVILDITPDWETGEGELSVRLRVNYSFYLPTLLEQGH